MRQFINGQEHEIPVNPDGTISVEVVRRRAGIPSGRAIIMKKPDGSNEVINSGEKLMINPDQHLCDMPITVRG